MCGFVSLFYTAPINNYTGSTSSPPQTISTQSPIRKECSESQWQCDNGECINIDFYCDKHPDCIDQSDEQPSCRRSGKFKRSRYMLRPYSHRRLFTNAPISHGLCYSNGQHSLYASRWLNFFNQKALGEHIFFKTKF